MTVPPSTVMVLAKPTDGSPRTSGAVQFYNGDMDERYEYFDLDISGYVVLIPSKSMIEQAIDQEIFNNWSVHEIKE